MVAFREVNETTTLENASQTGSLCLDVNQNPCDSSCLQLFTFNSAMATDLKFACTNATNTSKSTVTTSKDTFFGFSSGASDAIELVPAFRTWGEFAIAIVDELDLPYTEPVFRANDDGRWELLFFLTFPLELGSFTANLELDASAAAPVAEAHFQAEIEASGGGELKMAFGALFGKGMDTLEIRGKVAGDARIFQLGYPLTLGVKIGQHVDDDAIEFVFEVSTDAFEGDAFADLLGKLSERGLTGRVVFYDSDVLQSMESWFALEVDEIRSIKFTDSDGGLSLASIGIAQPERNVPFFEPVFGAISFQFDAVLTASDLIADAQIGFINFECSRGVAELRLSLTAAIHPPGDEFFNGTITLTELTDVISQSLDDPNLVYDFLTASGSSRVNPRPLYVAGVMVG
jgi:hypothetical protein